MNGWTTITVNMPSGLATAMLEAAAANGQRTGEASIRLEEFILVSAKAFEGLSNGLRRPSEQHCGGAAARPERGSAAPPPAA